MTLKMRRIFGQKLQRAAEPPQASLRDAISCPSGLYQHGGERLLHVLSINCGFSKKKKKKKHWLKGVRGCSQQRRGPAPHPQHPPSAACCLVTVVTTEPREKKHPCGFRIACDSHRTMETSTRLLLMTERRETWNTAVLDKPAVAGLRLHAVDLKVSDPQGSSRTLSWTSTHQKIPAPSGCDQMCVEQVANVAVFDQVRLICDVESTSQ